MTTRCFRWSLPPATELHATPSSSSTTRKPTNTLHRPLTTHQSTHLINAALQHLPSSAAVAIRRLVAITKNLKVDALIAYLSSAEFRREALAFLYKHRWEIFLLLVAILLIANPVALAGFGAAGPIAGSIAAGWQASMGGYVAAGSIFAILQSIGMTAFIGIPVAGGVLGGGVLVWMRYKPVIMEWLRRMRGYNSGGDDDHDKMD